MGILFGLLLLAAIGVSIRLGDRGGIFLSVSILGGSIATVIMFLAIGQDWLHFNGAIIFIDLVLLIAFAGVSFGSHQRWPMLVCALQFIVTLSHVAAIVGDTPATRILGVAQGLWAYFQCFAIIFGVMHHRRPTSHARNMMTDK
jgi:hypothetical protein